MLTCNKLDSQNANVSLYQVKNDAVELLNIETTFKKGNPNFLPDILILSISIKNNNSPLSHEWLRVALEKHILTECIDKKADYISAEVATNDLLNVFEALKKDVANKAITDLNGNYIKEVKITSDSSIIEDRLGHRVVMYCVKPLSAT